MRGRYAIVDDIFFAWDALMPEEFVQSVRVESAQKQSKLSVLMKK